MTQEKIKKVGSIEELEQRRRMNKIAEGKAKNQTGFSISTKLLEVLCGLAKEDNKLADVI